jgi:hypothetical protein
LFAIPDAKRPEFYEIEIEDHWYYIHIPSQITGVYLIAAARQPRVATRNSHKKAQNSQQDPLVNFAHSCG